MDESVFSGHTANMRIEFLYKDQSPAYCDARDFVRQFVRERGLLATVEERQATSNESVLIVDGQAFALTAADETRKSVTVTTKKRHEFLAAILEEQLWCL